ncbi:Iron(II)-dependent oxidoreductase EgtB [Rubripirellula amarantea]|uniref:Iron(II)-dependent oxidoreductase EgtB n=1 Tax=Rubripirellula amarantea TaxID=2527999 RepID=A0A5C5WJP1_9BACT|nr:ergothioneine biosynthesis protein EgtB [Rubripirellula amarantea]TWT50870.1 Iron(II)-dependent oxidoreductase EgtB [Rubripirellula amarantea]
MSVVVRSKPSLRERFVDVRDFSDRITRSLSPEDCMVQSTEDASPIRWHLAHTTWFFETFVLKQDPTYQEFHPEFAYLFNSYYNAVGKQFPRPQRGTISRPGLDGIRDYRAYVDQQMMTRMESAEFLGNHSHTIEVGLNHEQQHQELILTDIKHALSANPMLPIYEDSVFDDRDSASGNWDRFDSGQYEIGHRTSEFCFDNEEPRHTVYLPEFSIAADLVTCGQFINFIEDGGYRRPELWLSLGWNAVNDDDWASPLYWVCQDGQWMQFTLAGLVPVNRDWPVCHVSYFEADAYARWAGCRLPTEFEWEFAGNSAASVEADSSESIENHGQFADRLFRDDLAIHPTRSSSGMAGAVWQWTSSSYQAYPGYRPPDGAIGEYNGKFMCNQYVLRGGSVATSSSHYRNTYRNFFPANARWQFSGLRLAR